MITRHRRLVKQFEEVNIVTDVVGGSPMGSPVRDAGFAEPEFSSIPAMPLGSGATGKSRSLTRSPLPPIILLRQWSFRFTVSKTSPTITTNNGHFGSMATVISTASLSITPILVLSRQTLKFLHVLALRLFQMC